MPGLLSSVLSISLAAFAPSSGPAPIPSPASITDDPVEQAQAAWQASPPDYARARELLEPVARDEPLDDSVRRQKVLLLLADATLLDGTIPNLEKRTARAAVHLERLLDADAEFRFPEGLYSEELDNLFVDVRERRTQERAAQCEGEKFACQADVKEQGAQIARMQKKYDGLERKYNAQEVEQIELIQRSRALAIFPLGISHFLNRKYGIGGAFLAAETVFGVAGLSLLIYRRTVDGCVRQNGFQPGSLQCDPRRETSEEAVVTRRQWEEAMAWGLLVTAVADVVVAQILFNEYTQVSRGVKKRSELNKDPKTGGKGRRRRDRKAKPRAKVRPTPTLIERGAGLALSLRF